MLDELPRRRLFGLDFVDVPDEAVVARSLLTTSGRLAPGDPPCLVITPNVDHLVRLDGDVPSATRRLTEQAAVVLPDGQPVVWASRLVGRPLAARLTGSTLLSNLWPDIVADRTSVLVIASDDDLARRVRAEHPSADVVVGPHLADLNDEAVEALAVQIVGTWSRPPRFVLVTLGFPQRDRLIEAVLRHWPPDAPAPLVLSIGAAFEMYYGLRRRAPRWVQRAGLEWFVRFVQEPRRLFRRYFVEDPVFVKIVWREWRAARADDGQRNVRSTPPAVSGDDAGIAK